MTELDSEVLLVLRVQSLQCGKLQPFFVSFSLMDAARETPQQHSSDSTDSTHVVTPDRPNAAIIGAMDRADPAAVTQDHSEYYARQA